MLVLVAPFRVTGDRRCLQQCSDTGLSYMGNAMNDVIHPQLDRQLETADDDQAIAVIISLQDEHHWQEHLQLLARKGLEVTGTEPVIAAVFGNIHKSNISGIANLAFVKIIEPDADARALI